jgi:hypothetical protein
VNLKMIQILLILLPSFLLSAIQGYANDRLTEEQIEVSLRMIGHQVLLNVADDSTSLVLPILEDAAKYRIQFETEFTLNPNILVETVVRVVRETSLAKHYVLEVESCSTGEVVYSFEISDTVQSGIIPCQLREYPLGCYTLVFTLIKSDPIALEAKPALLVEVEKPKESTSALWFYMSLGILILIAIILFLMFKKKKVVTEIEPTLITEQEPEQQGFVINHNVHMISLGVYLFNRITGELKLNEQKTQLTGKESDLLQLLFENLNTTVERDVILSEVWGDEGDYVGRTLDVFISKLRKKLEEDNSVKIANVRGVGYKLVIG